MTQPGYTEETIPAWRGGISLKGVSADNVWNPNWIESCLLRSQPECQLTPLHVILVLKDGVTDPIGVLATSLERRSCRVSCTLISPFFMEGSSCHCLAWISGISLLLGILFLNCLYRFQAGGYLKLEKSDCAKSDITSSPTIPSLTCHVVRIPVTSQSCKYALRGRSEQMLT